MYTNYFRLIVVFIKKKKEQKEIEFTRVRGRIIGVFHHNNHPLTAPYYCFARPEFHTIQKPPFTFAECPPAAEIHSLAIAVYV